jgi:hypothetical protein
MITNIKKLLQPVEVENLKRYGGKGDGGYIFQSDLINESSIAYSYGVGPTDDLISFDKDIADLGKSVYLYDGSVQEFWDNRPEFFFKSEYVNSKNILTHIRENGHTNFTNMILKMDIEGAEYETLNNVDVSIFSYFNQIGIEIHNLVWQKSGGETILKLLTRLSDYYYLVHIHGNNCSPAIIDGLPDVLELTYIRKDVFDLRWSVNKLLKPCPIDGLDYPNSSGSPEISMDWWCQN